MSGYLVRGLGWQTMTERRDYLTATLMFKCIHELAPFYLSGQVTMMCDIIPYNSRSTYTMDEYVPRVTKELTKNAFFYQGPMIWNKLPTYVKESTSLNSFKHNYK